MNGWVTVALAADASRRPKRTIRTWVLRGKVSACCRAGDRTLLVWWPDVYDLTFTTERRATRRRAA